MQTFTDLLKREEDARGVSMYEMLTDPLFSAELEAVLRGEERGFNERADVVYQMLDGTDMGAMWREFNQTLELRNSQRDRIINWLTYRVSDPIEQVRYPTADDFEEASEYGQPKGVRLSPPYNMGFDFRWYDLAMRFTWMYLAEADQSQIVALHNQALEADNRLMMNKVLKTVFNPLNVASSIRNIPVTVYKFWNGDGIAPPYYKTYTHAGTHNHYITSGGATLASAGLVAMEDHLYHHGYSAFNGYKMLLFVNRQEGKVIRGARVTGGWQYDFIPNGNNGGGVFLASNALIVGVPDGADMPGSIGTWGPWIVIEEDYIPAGYVVGLVSEGQEGIGNPVGIREHQNAALRGLKLVPGSNDEYPLVDSFYRRGFGTGIRHRGAGVVMQVTAAGSYTTPAAYV